MKEAALTIQDFSAMKERGVPISMVTCYDSWSAALIEQSDIDCILVGDSLAMVMHGYDTTIFADSLLVSLHVQAVRRGSPSSFIIGDMPFLSYRKGLEEAMRVVEQIMRAGANAVKLEGLYGHEEIISHIVASGVPVMGHLGLTPQSVHQLGGYRVQGRSAEDGEHMVQSARRLQELGCFALVLECVPADLAEKIAADVTVPVIGIGAGSSVDGQVLVLHDMLGLSTGHTPKFVRSYMNGADLVVQALNAYDRETKDRSFPSRKESYR